MAPKHPRSPDKPAVLAKPKPLHLELTDPLIGGSQGGVPVSSALSIDTQLKSQSSANEGGLLTPASKKPRNGPPSSPTFVMQLYGVAVKDSYKRLFEDTVHDSWPHIGTKVSRLSVLVGTAVVSGKQVVILVPDGMVEAVVSMLGVVAPLTYIKIKDPVLSPTPVDYHSYDSFLLTSPPTAARPIAENRILDTTFNGDGCDLAQAAALEGTGKTFILAGYMTKPVVFYAGKGPANVTLLVNGAGDAEVTIKVWSDVNKRLAANVLEVGPVFFDVTAKKSTYNGRTETQYHCNSPHFGTPLGGPLGPVIAAKAQDKLSKEALVKITAYDMLRRSVPGDLDPSSADSGDGPVIGVVVKISGADSSEEDTAVIRSSRVAASVFGDVCGVGVDVFTWLADRPWQLEFLSAYSFEGTIIKGDEDLEAGCIVIEGFYPVP